MNDEMNTVLRIIIEISLALFGIVIVGGLFCCAIISGRESRKEEEDDKRRKVQTDERD